MSNVRMLREVRRTADSASTSYRVIRWYTFHLYHVALGSLVLLLLSLALVTGFSLSKEVANQQVVIKHKEQQIAAWENHSTSCMCHNGKCFCFMTPKLEKPQWDAYGEGEGGGPARLIGKPM